MAQVAYSVQVFDWSVSRCRGMEEQNTPEILSLPDGQPKPVLDLKEGSQQTCPDGNLETGQPANMPGWLT